MLGGKVNIKKLDERAVIPTCGTKLLRDSRNFIKKQNSKDGLSARCKMCDKEIRDRKKEEKINEK